ncbi:MULTISPECIES: NADPH-dependent assimilatory sulfite reductase hemoprotein subunit [Prochlorococcus]|uniref:Ferredoxin-sulfite reductase n=1 Tax=Prochlorococcus marinus (strain SARG / CCMP1375 / SS120) TaxID=167539 RepID=Q7VCB1_PROMA|nr:MULTISPECIES: NADPH-dependent assimilatory sulfite reductase hemoprotein subunit [Prochlorococcus]AAP99874.1 Ferredoxin-sulfite reductase [Prochlorococcus marinus subsp. marinus str. CCMP1375]KGG11779.1 Ferredoxin--sulfite reductase [Prochlorococcus marinus str. LG]KGG18807.1 Ferredoxin--sulfite reductase [Prochlorococcus marinus str. SS2]KGG23655.1 Ferredoxin--sulfite reductase [Prochlorococcus marinus str. SS35]KGG32109.1 Ferredoxin--sulfite reductase [Prochlorococcus marinus str. SS51]
MTTENIQSEDIKDPELFPCIANGQDRSKFEQFKADSNYLKEPLASELKNESNHFSNDAVQLLKFHGSYQQDNRENRKKGLDKDWQMMLRLRSPGGYIPAELFVALDDLSNRFGNKTLRATTRQAFQMHGIRKENLKEVISTIVKSMGSTLAACGDINRNVMAPAAPYNKGGYPAARKLANEIADLLIPLTAEGTYLELWADGDLTYKICPSKKVQDTRKQQFSKGLFSGDSQEPLYGSTYLPRKFKCAVTVPGDNSVDLLTHDIGLVAFTKNNGELKGCNVYVGGGMGRIHNTETTFARIADPLGYIDAKDVLSLVQSILTLQRDFGNRKLRKNARMKYLLHNKGLKWFKNKLISKYFFKGLQEIHPEPTTRLKDYLGWNKQSKGLYFVGIPLISGRLSGDIKEIIRCVVEKYQLEIRLTPNQDLLLCNIGNYQVSSIKKELAGINIPAPSSMNDISRHAIACPALPLCGLAITEAERFLPELINRIDIQLKKLKIQKSILLRMTGCPNGCARPYMAELALVGSGVNQYQLWLGGSPNLQRLAKPYLQKMHIDKLEATLEPLFINWKQNSLETSFGDYISSLSDQLIMDLLSDSSTAP